jgi:hypothetical protein
MSLAASSLLFALWIPITGDSLPAMAPPAPISVPVIEAGTTVVAGPDSLRERAARVLADLPPGMMQLDAPGVPRRSAALSGMYVTFAALQGLDAYSTSRAVAAGAVELNPSMRPVAGNLGAMVAVKGAATATAILFIEKIRKRNRKGALILMATLNGVTAAVVANNLRQQR